MTFKQIIKEHFSAKGARQGTSFATICSVLTLTTDSKQAEADAKALSIAAGTLAQDAAAHPSVQNNTNTQKEGSSRLGLARLELVVKSKLQLDEALRRTSAIKADEKAIADTT